MLLLLAILLLLLTAGAWGQSGDRDSDMEPTVSCTSHISINEGSTITCQLVPGGYDLEDDEDNDSDGIKTMTACCCALGKNPPKCVKAWGATVNSKDLNSNSVITLTVLSTRGSRVQTQLDLRKIIKPKSPRVWNVTLNQDNAVVYIQIPYHGDYLRLDNQQFQLQLWGHKSNKTHNMTSDSMNIGMDHLHKGTKYHVKVRAIPIDYFQGTWSEWSHVYSFKTPKGDVAAERIYILVWSVIPLAAVVVVVLSAVFLWRNKIFTYMWPSIPHPKTTLVQICRPNNGFLLIYKPEEFSSLKVDTVDQSKAVSCCETQPVLSPDGTEETPQSSTQTTHSSISSVPTEELELLSQSSSSDGDQSPTQAERVTYEGDTFTSGQQEDSYVTMSSFYQIKNNGMVNRAQTQI